MDMMQDQQGPVVVEPVPEGLVVLLNKDLKLHLHKDFELHLLKDLELHLHVMIIIVVICTSHLMLDMPDLVRMKLDLLTK